MALFGGKKPTRPAPEVASFVLRGKHAKPISPINDNPEMTEAQKERLASDVAMFDRLDENK